MDVKEFGVVNYAVVVLYLLAIVGIGSSFYRRRTTAKEYFLGGRSNSWIPAGISILAADLSAITLMGAPAWGFQHNLELAWSCAGCPLTAPLIILIFVPFYTRLNLYTAYEYLERRFNFTVRILVSITFHILRCVHLALVVYAPSLVINLVTGMPIWKCIVCMGVFTTAYTALGGIQAVIWTDVIQFSAVMSGVIVVYWKALGHIHGGMKAAIQIAADGGRLRLFNFSTQPTELTSIWACVIGGAILCMAPMTTDQAVLQRLLTTKSERDCRQSVLLRSILLVPVSLLLYLTGTALYVFYHQNPNHLGRLPVVDSIMPFFAVRELAPGFAGLVIAAILAASMGVMSASVNSLATATTVDFYQRIFRPHETSEHYARVGRIGAVCWGLTVTVLALFAGRLGQLAIGYDRVASVLVGPMLGIFLLGTLNARTTSGGCLIGALAGLLIVLAVSLRTEWSFFLLGPIGVAITVTAGYFVSLLMQPPPSVKILGLVKGLPG